MNGSDRIEDAFEKGKTAGRSLFITYLCAGDPDFETSLEACRAAIEGGTDILELGVPFSDPLADGPTNQMAAQRALASGMTYERTLELVSAIRQFSEVPVVFYTYYNLIFTQGEQEYVRQAKAMGLDGILTLDLPPEEAYSFNKTCAQVGLKTVGLIAPTTPPERVALIAKNTTGFLYYVSQMGVTGERKALASDLKPSVAQIRTITSLPLVVGFGISSPEQVRTVAEVADGVVVGSSLVNCLTNHLDDPKAAVSALRNKVTLFREALS